MARREPLHTSLIRDMTAYLCYSLLITTMGPLQFGFHLVSTTLLRTSLQVANESTGRAKCSSRCHHLRERTCFRPFPHAWPSQMHTHVYEPIRHRVLYLYSWWSAGCFKLRSVLQQIWKTSHNAHDYNLFCAGSCFGKSCW